MKFAKPTVSKNDYSYIGRSLYKELFVRFLVLCKNKWEETICYCLDLNQSGNFQCRAVLTALPNTSKHLF